MTAIDLTGFYDFSPLRNRAIFSTFRAISLLNRTTWRRRDKNRLEKIQKNPVETAPRNCEFLSLVVVECVLTALNRERKLNTNFFFLKLFGHRRDIPAKSRDIPPKSLISLVSRDIPNFLAPTHSRGRPPPHPKISGPKSLGLGSFFFPD